MLSACLTTCQKCLPAVAIEPHCRQLFKVDANPLRKYTHVSVLVFVYVYVYVFVVDDFGVEHLLFEAGRLESCWDLRNLSAT